jgi:hypothetical protein
MDIKPKAYLTSSFFFSHHCIGYWPKRILRSLTAVEASSVDVLVIYLKSNREADSEKK